MPAYSTRQNDLDLLVKLFAAPVRIMVAIAFAVGRMREYGALKPAGAENRHLYWVVAQSVPELPAMTTPICLPCYRLVPTAMCFETARADELVRAVQES